jgi:hypothetical protein
MLASKTSVALALSALLLAASVADASARQFSRSRSVTTPSGETYTSSTSGQSSCDGYGNCSRTVTHTGAGGGTTTVNGSASCANGGCSSQRTVTGPNGGTVTRTRSRHR